MAYHGGRLYVTRTFTSIISVYDAATGALLQAFDSLTYGLGGGYTGIAFDPEGSRFIIASYFGNRLDALTTNGIFSTLASISSPYHVAYEAPGRFVIACESSIQRLTVAPTPTVAMVLATSPTVVAAAPDGFGKIYLGNFLGSGQLRRMNADGTSLEDLGDPGLGGGTLYHVLVVRSAGSANLSLRNITRTMGGAFAFDLMGAAGAQLTLDVSTNLTQWSLWRTVTIPSGGITNIVDFNSNSAPHKFYRAVRP